MRASDAAIDLAREADFQLGALFVFPANCEVVCGDLTITLQPRVMQVLVALARAGGRIVSREALLASCWAGVVVGDDAIGRCIGRLRRLSEVEAPGEFTIVTQPRLGYRIVATDAPPSGAATKPSTPLEPPAGDEDLTPRGRPFASSIPATALLGFTVVILALAAAAAFALWTRPPPPPFRVAVRDFKVEGASSTLGESLANRVAAALSGRQLPVVARDRSRHGDLDGAHYVVGGDVRRIAGALRVDVELDDVRSGLTLWTGAITRSAAEDDALQDQVAGKVADMMDLTRRWLGPSGDAIKPDAVAALIRATDVMRGGGGTLLETREAFRRFRELAPESSRAHSAYAMATARSLGTQPAGIAAQWRSEARSDAQRAIALDPKNGEGYTAMGVLTPSNDRAQREYWFARGLSMDPNNSSLCNFLGNFLLGVGRIKEGVLLIDRSAMLDPLSPPKAQSVIFALAAAGRFGDAAALFPRADRLWPDDAQTQNIILFTSLIYAPPAQASAMLEKFQAGEHPLPPERFQVWRAFLQARTEARGSSAAIRSLDKIAPTVAGDELDAIVKGLASLGDPDDAFRVIEAARVQRRGFATSMLYEPATVSLRGDPRFKTLANQLGLLTYWAKTGTRPDFCAGDSSAAICQEGEAPSPRPHPDG